MIGFLRPALVGLALVVAGVVSAGCQANGGGTQSSASASPGTPTAAGAVMCDMCRTTWVQYPTAPNASGGRSYLFRGYTMPGQTVCASCMPTVETMAASGQRQATCPDCGGKMMTAMAH